MDNNGFFDLNVLFQKFYSFNNNVDFFNQKYIELEAIGKRKKFWFTIDDGKTIHKYLYKKCDSKNNYEAYGEILAKEIAVILGIPCADYMLAKFDYQNSNLNDFKCSHGVITPSFLKENERLVPIGEIISSVYNQIIKNNNALKELYGATNVDDSVAINRFNNLEDIWPILDCYFKDYPNKQEIVKQVMEYFVKVYLFDIITLQGDRHIWNIGVIINGETNEVRPAPIYDNANIFNLNRPKITQFLNIAKGSSKILTNKSLALQKKMVYNMLYHSKLLFSANSEDFLSKRAFDKKVKQLESLESFLKKSDNTVIELLESYISNIEEIGVHNIISNYETNMSHQFPKDFVEYFCISFQTNLDNIKQVLQEYKSHYRR